jgi:hypothetical protein
MSKHGRSLRIVTHLKPFTVIVGLVIVLACLAIAIGSYSKRVNRKSLKYYAKSGRLLRGELKTNPSILENSIRHDRYVKGFNILHNIYFDDDIEAFKAEIAKISHANIELSICYVDERIRVAQLNFTQDESDTQGVGRVFVAAGAMPPESMRMFGTTELTIYLRKDKNMKTDSANYTVTEAEEIILMVSEDIFDRIEALNGQFILLSKEGMVLDRFKLSELGIKGDLKLNTESNSHTTESNKP